MANAKQKNGAYKSIVSWFSDDHSFEPVNVGNKKAIEISSKSQGQSVTIAVDDIKHLIKVAKSVQKSAEENEVKEVKEAVSEVKSEMTKAIAESEAKRSKAEAKATVAGS